MGILNRIKEIFFPARLPKPTGIMTIKAAYSILSPPDYFQRENKDVDISGLFDNQFFWNEDKILLALGVRTGAWSETYHSNPQLLLDHGTFIWMHISNIGYSEGKFLWDTDDEWYVKNHQLYVADLGSKPLLVVYVDSIWNDMMKSEDTEVAYMTMQSVFSMCERGDPKVELVSFMEHCHRSNIQI